MSKGSYFIKEDWSKEHIDNGKSYVALPVLNLPVEIKSTTIGNTNIINKVDNALFLLSQTRIGHDLLLAAQTQNIKIICDDKAFEGEDMTSAMVWKGHVYIRSTQNVDRLALSLTHELMHISQNQQELLNAPHSFFRLDRAIQREWATEAEAFAASAQFAVELSLKDPDAPENSWTSKTALNELAKRDALSHLATQAVKAEDVWSGNHMAVQFQLFYCSPNLRGEYAKRMLENFNKFKERYPATLNAVSYKKDIDKKRLSDSFNYLSKRYLSENLPDMDLLSGEYSAMPENLKDDVVNFYDKSFRLTHIFQRHAVKNIQTYKDEDITPKIYLGKKPKIKNG